MSKTKSEQTERTDREIVAAVRELTPQEAEKLPSKARENWEGSQPETPSPDPFAKVVINTKVHEGEYTTTITMPDGTTQEIIRENRPRGMRKGGITGAKVIEVDGIEYPLQRRDPYGFWYILNTKEDLGTFTGHEEATQALVRYLRKKQASA